MPELVALAVIAVIALVVGSVLAIRWLVEEHRKTKVAVAQLQIEHNHEEMAELLHDILVCDTQSIPMLSAYHRDTAQRLISEQKQRKELSR